MDTIQIFFNCEGKKYGAYTCKADELLSCVGEKFKKDSGILNSEMGFIWQGDLLDQNKTLKELNIKNMATIDAPIYHQIIGGGLSINFTDLSKNIYEEHYLETVPDYRIVSKGINVYGICKVKKCEAYNKEVIYPLKEKKYFDLLKEREDLECPICGYLMIPKTLGFFSCEYRIKGKYGHDNKIIPFDFKDKSSKKDSIRYFNPDKNGNAMLFELIVEVINFL